MEIFSNILNNIIHDIKPDFLKSFMLILNERPLENIVK